MGSEPSRWQTLMVLTLRLTLAAAHTSSIEGAEITDGGGGDDGSDRWWLVTDGDDGCVAYTDRWWWL